MDKAERATLPGRAWRMLRSPAIAWSEVAAEPADARRLLATYVAPLAAIGPLCAAIGLQVFGGGIPGMYLTGAALKPGVAESLLGAALDYAFSLLTVWIMALAISALAPRFGGSVDRARAFSLVGHAATAFWLAGFFALYPVLGLPVTILGALYSLYALYLGLPMMMRCSPEQTLTYLASVLLVGGALILALRWAAVVIL